MKSKEAGISLIEVIISTAIFAIFILGVIYIFVGSAARVTEDNQLSNLHTAGISIFSLLAVSQNPQNWNGAQFTSTGITGVPASDSSLDADNLSGIQRDMSLAANGANITLTVSPQNGSTCPCSVSEAYHWKGSTWATIGIVRY